MIPIDELRSAPHLYGIKQVPLCGAEVYSGRVEFPDFAGTVIFGYNEGGRMEHVSISLNRKRQIPTWEQMCRLKDLFFRPDEMVVQIHPAEDRYVHGVGRTSKKLENVLHLWRPMDGNWEVLNHPEEWD